MGEQSTTGNKFNMTNASNCQQIQYRQLVDMLKANMSEKRKQVVD
jgi:hypothetical protein